MKKIAGIVDYGAGNLFSAIRGLNMAGFSSIISKSSEILNSDYLVIPGVGTFGDGIKNMKKRNFEAIIGC